MGVRCGSAGPAPSAMSCTGIHPQRRLDHWPSDDRRTRFVVIADGIDEQALESLLLTSGPKSRAKKSLGRSGQEPMRRSVQVRLSQAVLDGNSCGDSSRPCTAPKYGRLARVPMPVAQGGVMSVRMPPGSCRCQWDCGSVRGPSWLRWWCSSCQQRRKFVHRYGRYPSNFNGLEMAERKGFEPLRRFPAYTLSRRAPSTTRPPLRIACPPVWKGRGHGLPRGPLRARRNIPIKGAGARDDLGSIPIVLSRLPRTDLSLVAIL
jgi:hypothetical protein